MVTLDIQHPQAKRYTEKELETIALKLVYNYLDLRNLENLEKEAEEEVDYTPYEVQEEDLTEWEKKALNNYRTNKDTMKFYNLTA